MLASLGVAADLPRPSTSCCVGSPICDHCNASAQAICEPPEIRPTGENGEIMDQGGLASAFRRR
jgi:hypothetical protein